mmetsp:Transcript_17809/g.37002  ORF Transcript_17809/g.37002 Transcript_17809/m.37002 type:complete len:525 (+) Transcript_17809:169-1743(+)|eukprot:CAMPEP_0118637566 /NCGR_PEP_ID=MMETSP0785-20121206/3219_1 /TAXON_ID=91992 /ORGANISM="Bolidomonas pacifica, Strain CCMP 1866" /LENGTH=524 /DNA_ID=CAMNT_0006528757 /DNA_START=119 /DNA_END=1693 /DNA_ORIENTATION=-
MSSTTGKKGFMSSEVCKLLPTAVVGICLGILRSKFTSVDDHDPTEEQLILPQPPFCSVPDANLEKLFYFDLGGTYCLCEKQWSTNEYWQKTLSGMAFNFPHLLNGFILQLAIGNLLYVTFAEFCNEFIEEAVIACSQHWGFNNDPAYDLEPRYDTLMRDVIHCFLGSLLAYELGKVIKCEPWIKYPIKWDLSVPSSDRRSVKRHAKVIFFGFFWWQAFLLYNADGGVNSFSINNLMCTILVPLLFGGAFYLNKDDFEDSGVNPKRVVTWHLGPCIALMVGCALSIYPVKSTIYLIMLYEGVLKIMILVLEVLVSRYEWVRRGMGIDADSDPDSPVWLTANVNADGWSERGEDKEGALELSAVNAKVTHLGKGGGGGGGDERDANDKLGRVNPNHPALEERFQNFLEEESDGCRVLKAALLENNGLRESVKAAYIATISEKQREQERELERMSPMHPDPSYIKMAKMALSFCFGVFFITMGILEPMVYSGTDSLFTDEKVHVNYGRHWCGNPNGPLNGVNTCANH